MEIIAAFFAALGAFLVGAFLWNEWQKKQTKKSLMVTLIHEIWLNLNYVSQIEDSHKANLTDLSNIHIPHFPPRAEVIGKLMESQTLFSLPNRERMLVVEIFAQLEGCRRAFEEWKHAVYWPGGLISSQQPDRTVYEIYSGTLIGYVSPTMRNMLNQLIELIEKYDTKSSAPQIQNLKVLLDEKKKMGKWMRVCYKASGFRDSAELTEPRFDIVLCWANDWPDCPKDVIELQPVLRSFGSWKQEEIRNP